MRADSKAAMLEANARATDLCLEFHQAVTKDVKLRHELYRFVKDAKSAYTMTRALVMFGYMEMSGAKDPIIIQALCLAAKTVAYQHFMLNKRKYQLGKKH